MRESIPIPPSPEQALLERWEHVPIIIASQSRFRAEQLTALGFSHVNTSQPIPETIEIETAHALEAIGGIPSWHAKDGRDVTRFIASAKVQHVTTNETVPSDAVVLGFDTAPLIWHNDSNALESLFAHLEKPDSPESARRMIHHILTTTANGCVIRRQKLASFSQSTSHLSNDERDMVLQDYCRHLTPGTITISNAAAGSFPENRARIIGCTQEIPLYSAAIDAMRDDTHALEVLADKVADVMDEGAQHISGAIDYSNPYIQDVLQLQELKATFETGTIAGTANYAGFSKTLLIELLATAETMQNTSR